MNIGARIRNLREQKGITQAELAKKIMVDKSVMNRIEIGTRLVRNDELLSLSNVLGVSTDFLLGNKLKAGDDTIPSNDMNQFLSQAQIIFDGNAVNLSDKDRDILEQSLKIAFMAIEKQREGGNNGNEESH